MRTITVGRDNSCDIVINDPRISRVHANIIQQGSAYIYRDMSTNGTLINGVLLNRSDINVKYGDSVLLASTVALPWHKVQLLLPMNDDSSYIGSSQNQMQSDETIIYKNGTGWIIAGYIFAFLGGLFGVIIGLILAISTQIVNGKKIKKYSPTAVLNGWIIFFLAILMLFVWRMSSIGS